MSSSPQSRPTLAAVAAAAGVSRTTASNAYNRPDQLSPAVRAHVLSVAAELGYTGPDPVARSLRTRTASAVGLILADRLSRAFGDPAAVEFLQGAGQACEDGGRSLLLVPAWYEASNTETVERAAVDGFVIYSMPEGDRHIDAVLGRPQPAVIVDSPRGIEGVDFVGIDDRTAFGLIGRHILDHGHRRIGLIAAGCGIAERRGRVRLGELADERSSVLRERAAGLVDVLPADVDVSTWLSPGHSPENGRIGARELLAAHPRPTVIICMSDALAFGALQAAEEIGVAVPDQLSVTGFDDVPRATTAGLTTVRQPTREKGRRAVGLLAEPAAGAARSVVLPTELMIRRTSGPAPS